MRKILLILGLLTLAAAANPGRDAVDELVSKGLLKGYPNGQFEGQRAATRYEVVELLERFARLYDNATQNFVKRSDLEPVRQAVQTVREGLELLETRANTLDRDVKRAGSRAENSGWQKEGSDP